MTAVSKFLQDLDLAVEKLAIDVVLEHLEVDYFHSHAFIYMRKGLPVSSCRPR
jgi:hypothetical protein